MKRRSKMRVGHEGRRRGSGEGEWEGGEGGLRGAGEGEGGGGDSNEGKERGRVEYLCP